jgi:hypothetical protein
MGRKSGRNSGAGCSWFLCVAWALIYLWLGFLFYCWKSGFIHQKKTNSISDIAEKADASLRGSLAQPSFPAATEKDEIHVVFSTDCSAYQDWQTLLLFHSAKVVGQKGPITRIASGCDDAQKTALITLYKQLYPMYHVHFTPDFKQDAKSNKKYDFYNKPWGMKHWLEHAEPPIPDDIVVALLDPDMVFLRPLTTRVRGEPNLLTSKAGADFVFDKVVEGHPVGQTYGLGAPWTNDNHAKFNRHRICGEGSPCLQESTEFGEEHYSVGPPYVVHRRDMVKIVNSWTEFVPRVYEGYPFLLAEMYAYSMAAAHEKLPHLQVYQHMVSNVDSGGEGWDWVDKLANACEPPNVEGIFQEGKPLPTVLHYCQGFKAGMLAFFKRQVTKHNIFSCESPMFMEPANDLDREPYVGNDVKREEMKPVKAKRHGFAVCTLHRALNSAILDYKQQMCASNPNTNYAKTLNLAH